MVCPLGLRFYSLWAMGLDMALLCLPEIFSGKPIDVFNNGNHSRDTFVEDIVEGIVREMISSGKESSMGFFNLIPLQVHSLRVLNIGNNQY